MSTEADRPASPVIRHVSAKMTTGDAAMSQPTRQPLLAGPPEWRNLTAGVGRGSGPPRAAREARALPHQNWVRKAVLTILEG